MTRRAKKASKALQTKEIDRILLELEALEVGLRDEARADARTEKDLLKALLKAIKGTKKRAKVAMVPSKEVLNRLGKGVDKFATAEVSKQVEMFADPGLETVAKLGVSLSEEAVAIRSAWVKDNVSLAQKALESHYEAIEQSVRKAFEKGTNTNRLAKTIAEEIRDTTFTRAGSLESHAQLIARDQIAKLNSTINQDKQKKAGAKRYRWSTSGDERVRATHRALNKKVFTWEKPPAVGHPGEDYQCRCVAIPVFDD